MVGSPPFAAFLDALLEDLASAGLLAPPPNETGDRLDEPIEAPEPVGLTTRSSEAPAPQSRRARRRTTEPRRSRRRQAETARPVVGIEQMLDYVTTAGGTAWLDDDDMVRVLVAADSRTATRQRAVRITTETDFLRDDLIDRLPSDADQRTCIAAFVSLLHARRCAAALVRLNRLLACYQMTIGLDILVTSYRLPSRSAEAVRRHNLTGALRRGRKFLSAFVEQLADDTRHVHHAHQLLVGRQLTALAGQRVQWQRASRVARTARNAPPTPAERDDYEQYRGARTRLREMEAARAQRARERREGASDTNPSTPAPPPSAAERAAARREAREAARVHRAKVAELRREVNGRRRKLGNDAIRRVEDYLEAERLGIRPEDAVRRRDELLLDMDRRLAPLNVSVRLSDGSEDERWERYTNLTAGLIRNPYNISLELFMDSFLKVAQYVERTRDIGLEAHTRGHVQWLTYPGHRQDDAVDWNCNAGLDLLVSVPDVVSLPERYRDANERQVEYRYQRSYATDRINNSSDLQDIFAHIAGGLIRASPETRQSRGPRRNPDGGTNDDIARTMREHEGTDLAPGSVVTGRFSQTDAANILVGLLAQNLTEIQNARAFDQLRREILRDIEHNVRTLRHIPADTPLFRAGTRLLANEGRFGLARLVINISLGDLLDAVVTLLTGNVTRHYQSERRAVVHQLWRLLQWLRSAGAEPHRAGISAAIRHLFQSAAGQALEVEVYYGHLSAVRVGPASSLQRGTLIGRTGSTGNARNSHVHIDIRLVRDGTQIGNCLPHEFFADRPPAPTRGGS